MTNATASMNNLHTPSTLSIMHTSDRQLDPIFLKEYGRHVQNLIRRIQQESDKEKRTAYVKALVPLMITVNPQLKNSPASIEKVWHDIFLMTDYEIDIDVDHQVPQEPSLTGQPETMPYMEKIKKRPRYGRLLTHILEQVKTMDDKAYAELILLQMAKWLLTYRKKNTHIDDILYYFKEVIGKETSLDLASLKKQLQDLNIPQKNTKNYKKRYFRKNKKG